MKQEEQKKKKSKLIGCGVFLVLFIVLVVALSSCTSDTTTEPKAINELEAYIISQGYVENVLKSPSTADFSNYNYIANNLGDNKWIVASSVDSQNSFGAMIRTMYSVIITHNGGSWSDSSNWTLNELIIDDEIIYQEDAE